MRMNRTYYDPPKIPHPDRVDHNAQTGATLRAMHERYLAISRKWTG